MVEIDNDRLTQKWNCVSKSIHIYTLLLYGYVLGAWTGSCAFLPLAEYFPTSLPPRPTGKMLLLLRPEFLGPLQPDRQPDLPYPPPLLPSTGTTVPQPPIFTTCMSRSYFGWHMHALSVRIVSNRIRSSSLQQCITC